jgi:hypothetical protein
MDFRFHGSSDVAAADGRVAAVVHVLVAGGTIQLSIPN